MAGRAGGVGGRGLGVAQVACEERGAGETVLLPLPGGRLGLAQAGREHLARRRAVVGGGAGAGAPVVPVVAIVL